MSTNGITLHWRTETEVNNYGFEVERRYISKIMIDWQKVGFVEGAGTSNTPREYSFTDSNLPVGRYEYRLKQIDVDGTYKYSQSVEVEIKGPIDYALYQNYPNPFNPATIIGYQLPVASQVTLKVYDILGNEVSTLVNKQQEAGNYELKFDGSKLTSGVYFYKLQAGKYTEIKKLLLVK